MAETSLLAVACLTVVHNSIDPVIMLDKDHRIVKFNPSASQLLGLGNNDLQQPASQVLSRWSKTAAATFNDTPPHEKIIVQDASTRRRYELQIMPILDRSRVRRGSVLLVRVDTSSDVAEDAKSSTHSNKELLAKISHKLRTPLNGIQGLTEMLEYGTFGPLNERQLSATQRILERAEFLRDLLNDMARQISVESGRFEYFEEESEVAQ